MSTAQIVNTLIRAIRPASRSLAIRHAQARPLYQSPPPLWQPKGLHAAFTTSPAPIPPQSDTSTNTSTSHSPSTQGLQHQKPSQARTQHEPTSLGARKEPTYQLTFTCKPCMHRSSHEITKLGYHHGAVLITCPECKNKHVISDHLKVRILQLHSCPCLKSLWENQRR